MRISNREKVLLGIVGILVFAYIYYTFFMGPMHVKKAELEQSLAQKRIEYEAMQSTIRNAKETKKKLEELKKEILPDAQKYYGKTNQEEFIVAINGLNDKSGINITRMAFSDESNVKLRPVPPDENAPQAAAPQATSPATEATKTSGDEQKKTSQKMMLDSEENSATRGKEQPEEQYIQNIRLMQTDIEFLADYQQILKWLNAVDSSQRNIISGHLELVRNATEIVENESNPLMKGKVQLSFYQVEDVDKYLPEKEPSTLDAHAIGKGTLGNPFASYPWAWVKIQREAEAASGSGSYNRYQPVTGNPSQAGTGIPGGPVVKQPSVPVAVVLKKQELYGFEDGKVTAKTSSDKVNAEAAVATDIISKGSAASRMTYAFSGEEPKEKAYIDLDDAQILIKEKMENLSLKVYTSTASEDEVGLILEDAKGQEYQIVLSRQMSWVGWKELGYDFSGIQAYPVRVKGIYVGWGGSAEKLSGEIIVDDLAVSYLRYK